MISDGATSFVASQMLLESTFRSVPALTDINDGLPV
jgi:hypothetical protein